MFLTGTGALLDEKGGAISAINLATDYDELMGSDWVSGGMRLKMEEIKRLLDDLPLSSSVSITRPGELAKELFTHAGSGTLVRRGERMLEITEKAGLDAARATPLIEQAFGRQLVDGYFDRLEFDHAFVTESYRAAAITSRLDDVTYLDKFAVLDDARGEGLGGAVWRRLIAYAPKLYWRSRTDNPVNEFYFATCHGAVKSGSWSRSLSTRRNASRHGSSSSASSTGDGGRKPVKNARAGSAPKACCLTLGPQDVGKNARRDAVILQALSPQCGARLM